MAFRIIDSSNSSPIKFKLNLINNVGYKRYWVCYTNDNIITATQVDRSSDHRSETSPCFEKHVKSLLPAVIHRSFKVVTDAIIVYRRRIYRMYRIVLYRG